MDNIKKAPDIIESPHKISKLILKEYNEKVKFHYEMIDLFETAKEVSISQLKCMIQEAKEEVCQKWVVAKLESIMEKRFGYV